MRQNAGLIVVRPGFPDRRVPLEHGVARLGRAEDNEICLPDIGVSRRHARILVDDHGVTFEDLGSGNGSWFQGRKLSTHMVAHGDEVNIEPFTLRFELYEDEQTGGESTKLLGDAPGLFTDEPVAAHLELVNPVAGLRNSYGIPGAGLTLGRSEQRDIVIPDPAASRLHCEIVKVGGEYWAKDTGAANGLFVNEARIRERRLRDGDVIRIGATEFRFTCVGEDRGTDVLEHDEPENTEAFAGVVDAPLPPPPVAAPPPPPPANGAPAAPVWGAPAADPAPFGTPAQPAPAFGDAGPAPAPFGGADLGGGPKPVGKGPTITPIRVAIVGILALTVVMVVVKKGGELLDSRSGPTVVSSDGAGYTHEAAGVDAEDQAEVDALMDEGMELFMSEEYYAATSRFLQVLKIDPGHEDAERMGYLACEFISIGAMHVVVAEAAASDADKRQAKSDALAAAQAAMDGNGSVSDARDLVRQALKINPDDAELLDAEKSLSRKAGAISRANTERKHQKLSQDIGPMYDQAKAQLDRGDWVNAIKGFESVMAADPSKATEYYYQAQDGISDAKSRMRRAAQTPFKAGITAMERGDNLTARSKFRETLRLDPYHSSAKSKLSEVQNRLESEASDKYKEARVLEAANQMERALSLYSQVQKLVGDKNHELHKLAQQRIDALLR